MISTKKTSILIIIFFLSSKSSH